MHFLEMDFCDCPLTCRNNRKESQSFLSVWIKASAPPAYFFLELIQRLRLINIINKGSFSNLLHKKHIRIYGFSMVKSRFLASE